MKEGLECHGIVMSKQLLKAYCAAGACR
jgi:hypothetical protein